MFTASGAIAARSYTLASPSVLKFSDAFKADMSNLLKVRHAHVQYSCTVQLYTAVYSQSGGYLGDALGWSPAGMSNLLKVLLTAPVACTTGLIAGAL